ncbi:MAG: nucleoside phosphorylase [Abditibacteriaceae bacterium]
MSIPPILQNKDYDQPSLFEPGALIREARRQKDLSESPVPTFCVLDPDGDLSRFLKDSGVPTNDSWACYHTEMRNLGIGDEEVGVIGCAVGASFAVLVAEQLFVSGCEFLLSITSAGQLAPQKRLPCFQLIDHCLRDEGTSYHYLPPSNFVSLRPDLHGLAEAIMKASPELIRGGTWTTDAPYRETAKTTEAMATSGLLAVEMEAAALYAFAQVAQKDVLCFAHITNQMATQGDDFEKGHNNGNTAMIELIGTVFLLTKQTKDTI